MGSLSESVFSVVSVNNSLMQGVLVTLTLT